MKSQIVEVPAIAQPITRSPGFAKKGLATYKLDAMGLCGFGCAYCSSNHGNYLRINRSTFAEMTALQLGERTLPADNPKLSFVWPDFLQKLDRQLRSRRKRDWGEGEVLVYSMLTDGSSPVLVNTGVTEQALRMVLERTRFRIRILTKNAVVGRDKWIRLFEQHPGRFVVGLSIGTLDDHWAKRVEKFTAPPSRRIEALRRLQDAGVPTYGMLCPIFPDVLEAGELERLVDQIRPEFLERIWAEPYNDRANWTRVREGYQPDSSGFSWLTEVFGKKHKEKWSNYATELYVRLRDKAQRESWLDKLTYLLYEDKISASDAPSFRGLHGVLLQSKPGADGRSQNPHVAQVQRQATRSRRKSLTNS